MIKEQQISCTSYPGFLFCFLIKTNRRHDKKYKHCKLQRPFKITGSRFCHLYQQNKLQQRNQIEQKGKQQRFILLDLLPAQDQKHKQRERHCLQHGYQRMGRIQPHHCKGLNANTTLCVRAEHGKELHQEIQP